MIDTLRISEAEKNVQQYIQDGLLFTKRKDIVQFSSFFLKNAETSLLTAKVLFGISIDFDKKEMFALEEHFETFLWVVVSAYYAMFYSALALLAKNEIKVGTKIVHKVVADTLIVKFLKNQKLATLLENYEEIKNQALQIVGAQEKARELLESFEYERYKRHDLQYELGRVAKQNIAKTSLDRAGLFTAEIRAIILRSK